MIKQFINYLFLKLYILKLKIYVLLHKLIKIFLLLTIFILILIFWKFEPFLFYFFSYWLKPFYYKIYLPLKKNKLIISLILFLILLIWLYNNIIN